MNTFDHMARDYMLETSKKLLALLGGLLWVQPRFLLGKRKCGFERRYFDGVSPGVLHFFKGNWWTIKLLQTCKDMCNLKNALCKKSLMYFVVYVHSIFCELHERER